MHKQKFIIIVSVLSQALDISKQIFLCFLRLLMRVLLINLYTSLGSANIPTIAVSIASWFSNREARAAIKTTVSGSTPLAKTYADTLRTKLGTGIASGT